MMTGKWAFCLSEHNATTDASPISIPKPAIPAFHSDNWKDFVFKFGRVV
jgi:hypothetical protein